MLFRRNKGGTAVAQPELEEAERLLAEDRLRETLARLEAGDLEERDLELAKEARKLRMRAGVVLERSRNEAPSYPEPAVELPEPGDLSKVAEVATADLTPEILRGSILEYGCVIVRGLVGRDAALRLADEIDRAFAVRDSLAEGESDAEGYYDELQPDRSWPLVGRPWIEEGGGLLAVDSPKLLPQMFADFAAAGVGELVGGYLGEPPLISAEKTTLRKAAPDVPGAWHQDGKFMGDVRAINLWLSLSRCGDEAPGLDIVPTRLDEIQEAGGEGANLSIEILDEDARRLSGEKGITRPIFEPGDAMLFDDLFLHQTGSDPSMPNPRYAIESWFFGPSAFPEAYVPLVV